MGFKRESGPYFKVKCDNCGDTAEGYEDKLNQDGWSWMEMRVTVEGNTEILNRAICGECNWWEMGMLEKMKQVAGEEDEE